ncbi:MAG: molecular chaperone TorD family protein [Candidatus Dormibacteraceae bacterium]
MTQPAAAVARRAGTARWELLRALAAVVDTRPEASRAVVRALGLPEVTAAEHTGTFVLSCPPYAALHLGPEGKLGGVGADRVAGFWRALGMNPPPEPDHLSLLLTLYAHLGEAEEGAAGARTRSALGRARAALLAEHLWSWSPGFLKAVGDLGGTALPAWAALTLRALRREVRATAAPAALPLAMREAPGLIAADLDLDGLLDAILAPVRSGLVLSHRSLSQVARQSGAGYRAGERRFALRALLEQDARGTLEGLAEEARRWARRHQEEAPVDRPLARWWTGRANHTANVLAALAARAS